MTSETHEPFESVRGLLRWSAEYLRVAAELEATEQELRQQVDEFLASLPRQAKSHGGLPDWLKTLALHGHPARETGPDRPEADVAALMLGPLELDVAGRRVARWSSLKARAVFQYLLIHRDRPVRRDVLMELQWPGHTYTSARNNLNVALYSLRNTLDGPWHGLQPILYQDGCYALNPGLNWWVDRDEFLAALGQADLARASGQPGQAICRYQRAIQLYRGPLFEDDLTSDWYLAEQRHLNELYLQALERLGEIHFDLGEIASAKFYGQLALSSDSCCEPVHRLLMRCHAAENKQQLVTRQYRLCVDALHDELDVPPGAETLRLFRELTVAPAPLPDGAVRRRNVGRHEVKQVVPLLRGEVLPGVDLAPVGVERGAADLIRRHVVPLAIGDELLDQGHLVLRTQLCACA